MSILEQGNGEELTQHNNNTIIHGPDRAGNTLRKKNAIHISVSDSKKDSFIIVRLVDICVIIGG